MKKIWIVVLLLFIIPFVWAAELSSLIDNYEQKKETFLEYKAELESCTDAGDDCEDIENDVLDAAIDTAELGIEIMQAYIEYTAVTDADTLIEQLETAKNDLKYADSKEEFDAVIADVRATWSTVADDIKQMTVEDLYAAVDELVDKGELIDAKLSCGIDKLTDGSEVLDTTYEEFSAAITAADEKIDEAEALLEANDYDAALAAITAAQNSLKDSQSSLQTATTTLSAEGGELCAEVTITEDEDETEDETEDEAENESEDESETESEDEEEQQEEEEQDLDELLSDYGLSSYHNDATEAIETLVDYIDERKEGGDDTSEAEDVLADAETYLAEGEQLVLEEEGTGAISKFLNAQQTAERGLNSEYYSEGEATVEGSEDYQAFVDCMETASYSSQRDECYDDYDISGEVQDEIESCLSTADDQDTRYDCYEEAADEAEQQVDDEAQELQDRVDALKDDLEDLEEAVTDLYDALAAKDLDSDDEDFISIDADIDDLLERVQGDREEFETDLDTIEDMIEDEDYDEADNDLDTIESEIEDYVTDKEADKDDIQEDIDNI